MLDSVKQGKQAPRGLTVTGKVKSYVPVTDANLPNPDPADWLMIRHDYKANYYSTLNQITAQNVNDLRLVWTAGRRHLGIACQPVPGGCRNLDHRQLRASRGSGNGATLFANSTVALDADTGKLVLYYNHAPSETLDLDEVFERVLVDDQGQNYVFSAGKTGKYLRHGHRFQKTRHSA